jgi:hypothetical protein
MLVMREVPSSGVPIRSTVLVYQLEDRRHGGRAHPDLRLLTCLTEERRRLRGRGFSIIESTGTQHPLGMI